MRVQEIMSTNPAMCGPEAAIEEVARMMVDYDCGLIPILDDEGKALGVVTDRDIVCRAVAKGRNPLELRAQDLMSEASVTVSPEADIEECARLLQEQQVRRILVVDESGRCKGVVAQKMPGAKAAEVVREISKPTDEASRSN